MKSLCSQSIKIPSSKIDYNGKVGIIQALEIFQDNMCEYYKRLNCDGIYMIPRCHAFWALVKTKIKFYEDVEWLDKCNIKTDICKVSNVRMNLCSGLYDKDGKVAISCLQEMCGVDSDSRKLRMVDSIPFFPKDIEVEDNFSGLSFEKLDFALGEDSFCKSVIIGVSNVDFFAHTNNVEYVKLMLSTCTFDFIKSMKVLDFEIVYIKESVIDDELKIYKKDTGEILYFEIRKNGNCITKARINYKLI